MEKPLKSAVSALKWQVTFSGSLSRIGGRCADMRRNALKRCFPAVPVDPQRIMPARTVRGFSGRSRTL